MKWLKWRKHDINTIKIALKQKFRYRKEELADRLYSQAKIIRARRATVLRFLKRRCGRHRNQPVP